MISIHAPHARSDLLCRSVCVCPEISIHAPHARSDDQWPGVSFSDNISIHAPHARSDLRFPSFSPATSLFQSTLLMRGATFAPLTSSHCGKIFQSTLLMRGATCPFQRQSSASCRFQSTLLMRGATVSLSSIDLLDFIIHFSRTTHLFPKTLLLALCLVSPIFCVMALRA